MKKLRVLCICAKGINRSKYLAGYLRRKGYSTRYGGVEDGKQTLKKLNKKDIDWADIIIVVRKRHLKLLKKKFRTHKLKKKIIVLDVTDSRKLIPKKFAELKNLNHKELNRIWTYPKLRKAIKPYLPLKK